MTDSNAYDIVRRGDDGLQACVCNQIDDAAKLHALAADRSIDLSEFSP